MLPILEQLLPIRYRQILLRPIPVQAVIPPVPQQRQVTVLQQRQPELPVSTEVLVLPPIKTETVIIHLTMAIKQYENSKNPEAESFGVFVVLLMYITKGIRFTNLTTRLVLCYSTSCNAAMSSSPVRTFTTFATSYTKILPSPI